MSKIIALVAIFGIGLVISEDSNFQFSDNKQTKPAFTIPPTQSQMMKNENNTQFPSNNLNAQNQTNTIFPIDQQNSSNLIRPAPINFHTESNQNPQMTKEANFQFSPSSTSSSSSTPSGGLVFSSNFQNQNQQEKLNQNFGGENSGIIACTKNHDPLCGSDGKTYSNMCLFSQAQKNNQGLSISKRGEC